MCNGFLCGCDIRYLTLYGNLWQRILRRAYNFVLETCIQQSVRASQMRPEMISAVNRANELRPLANCFELPSSILQQVLLSILKCSFTRMNHAIDFRLYAYPRYNTTKEATPGESSIKSAYETVHSFLKACTPKSNTTEMLSS